MSPSTPARLPGADPAAGRPAVALEGVTKRYGHVAANLGVDLAVAPGEVHAVVGENGAGKSTAMSVMFGLQRPDEGRVLRRGQPVHFRSPADAIASGLGMVHQRFQLFPTLTVAENVVLGAEPSSPWRGIDRRRAGERVTELAERYGLAVDPAAVVGDLPVGVRQRVEILKALHREAEVLILDEPTAVLTPQEARSLFGVLRGLTAQGASVVLVTHRLAEVLEASDSVTVLRGGRVVGRHRTRDTTTRELVREMIGRDLDDDAPGRATAGTPAVGGGSTGGSTGGTPRPDAMGPGPGPAPSEARGLEVHGLTVRDADSVARLDEVSFTVRPGEIVGIAGVAGSGQRELVDALTGLRKDALGEVRLRGTGLARLSVRGRRRAGIGYVPEDRHGRATAAGMSLADNLAMGEEDLPPLRRAGGRLSRSAVLERAIRLVRAFSVRTPSVRSPVSALSGGNAQKAVLARELSRDLALLVAEEPTQGVDVGAQEAIHVLLRSAAAGGTAVLLVSSDLGELRALSDRVLVMFAGAVVRELPVAEATDEALGGAMTGLATAGTGGDR
jgi:general nucleoside transport system ATP-binding protein